MYIGSFGKEPNSLQQIFCQGWILFFAFSGCIAMLFFFVWHDMKLQHQEYIRITTIIIISYRILFVLVATTFAKWWWWIARMRKIVGLFRNYCFILLGIWDFVSCLAFNQLYDCYYYQYYYLITFAFRGYLLVQLLPYCGNCVMLFRISIGELFDFDWSSTLLFLICELIEFIFSFLPLCIRHFMIMMTMIALIGVTYGVFVFVSDALSRIEFSVRVVPRNKVSFF
jgi:hypothetical protein